MAIIVFASGREASANLYARNAILTLRRYKRVTSQVIEKLRPQYEATERWGNFKAEYQKIIELIEMSEKKENEKRRVPASTTELNFPKDLSDYCTEALLEDVRLLNDLEFLMKKADSASLNFLFEKMSQFHKNHYRPLLRDCESKHEK